jgi:hypothetical protein
VLRLRGVHLGLFSCRLGCGHAARHRFSGVSGVPRRALSLLLGGALGCGSSLGTLYCASMRFVIEAGWGLSKSWRAFLIRAGAIDLGTCGRSRGTS